MITKENWIYTHYQTETMKVLISVGGKMDENENFVDLYFVTTTDPEYKEKIQTEFYTLEEAIDFMNKSYGHLNELDTRISDSSCSSCVAH